MGVVDGAAGIQKDERVVINNFLFWAFPKNKEVDLLLAALKTLQPAKVVSPVSLT
jgi:hypothetical protein